MYRDNCKNFIQRSFFRLKTSTKDVQEALKQGFIQPSTSPAASSIFIMGKKDGGLRACIDYCMLNSQTVKLPYPLSLVPTTLGELRGARLFSKLDLRSAYNLIRIQEDNEWKTAFITSRVHYEYWVMPYGLAYSLFIFQGFMNEVIQEFLHRFVTVYIDDILPKPGQTLSPCEAGPPETQTAPSLPETGEVRIPRFSSSATSSVKMVFLWTRGRWRPLTNSRFNSLWRTCKDSLNSLTSIAGLSRTSACSWLLLPPYSEVSPSPCPGVLTPTKHSNGSRKLSAQPPSFVIKTPKPPSWLKWTPPPPEPGRTVTAMWRASQPPSLRLLVQKTDPSGAELRHRQPGTAHHQISSGRVASLAGGSNFTVITAHKNLQYLREAKQLNPRQAWWALFFTRFQFTIMYRPRNHNCKTDALSRLNSPDTLTELESILPPALIVSPIQWNISKDIRNATGMPRRENFYSHFPSLNLSGLSSRSTDSGHPSSQPWWSSEDTLAPASSVLVAQYGPGCHQVQSCSGCAMSKTPCHLPLGKLVPSAVPRRPWSHIGMDFVTDLPISDGNTCILIVVDRFSKACKWVLIY